MKLALFFTSGMSLAKWAEIGSFSREVKPYQELSKQFDKIYFFTYGSKNDLRFQRDLPSNIIILPNKWKIPPCLYGFLMPFFYWQVLKKTDIIKTNQMSAVVPALLAKWFFRKKLVLRCGYEWLNVLEKEKKALWKRVLVALLERTAYNKADKIILASEKDKTFVQKRFGVAQEKIAVVQNYIDTELFKPQEEVKKEGVLYVGRLSKEKNLLNLIEAAGRLKVKFVLIGAGPQENELRNFARDRGAEVDFLGVVPNENLPFELNKAKVFVLPSFYESSPKALLEAMACGLCCVASDVEGIREVIQDRENGLLSSTDAASIEKALKEALTDEALRERLGDNARRTIVQRFSLEYILNKEITLYLSLSS